MKYVDFLFLIEHDDRESNTVKELCKSLEDKGYTYQMLSIEFHSHYLLFLKAGCVIFPYSIDSSRWPLSYFTGKRFKHTKFVSLNWEQLLSDANKAFKAPKGEFIQQYINHLCWSDDFQSFLLSSGVKKKNTRVIGNPNHAILLGYMRQKDLEKVNLRKISGIPDSAELVFFPMNYGWAFSSDKLIKKKIEMGYDKNIAWDYRDYSLACLYKFVFFSRDIANADKNRYLVIRPHPSISIEQYIDVFTSKIGKIPDNIIFSKDYSVREWISSADIVGSSWSTSVWDSAAVGKKAFLFTPLPRPSWLETYWNSLVPNISKPKDFALVEQFDSQELVIQTDMIERIAHWIINLPEGNPVQCSTIVPFRTCFYFVRSFFRCFSVEFLNSSFIRKGLLRDYFRFSSRTNK
ncbi:MULTISPECIES: hypothetical protein [unclassified Agarivorans]|uniref:hypothetical protein n=1 Tax=unclassified Agarivorans TaxID=2636026 RepID=UPI0026E23D48|nr:MULTISPECIES: hypothetical protein [unclassified Agarivorans]MDO6686274.1 hypothetical protein [Agarivorans sp. 3_MG-2023]MDO6716277.1 hypothetical protein [Agarivorans sp. 2_MG-2023]